MNERTKGEPVPERGRHVRDGNIPVAIALNLTPLLKRFHGCHPAPVVSKVVLSASNRETNARGQLGHWPFKSRLSATKGHIDLIRALETKILSASYCRVACLWVTILSNDCGETRTELDTWG